MSGGRGLIAHACLMSAAQDAFTAAAAPATARRRAAFDAAYETYRAAQRAADVRWQEETAEARRAHDAVLEDAE